MEKKSKVVVVPCSTYHEEVVYEAMKCGIEALGGIGKFVKTNEKILVNPNFLLGAVPEDAVTTHPSVIKAMLRILQEKQYNQVIYGDSAGHGNCAGIARKLGLEKEVYGAKLADMSREVKLKFEEGKNAKEFYFVKEMTEVDAVIDLCKMKTHALERITGAVKNIYGLICGYRKAAGHVAYPNAQVFARMLADMHRYVKPRLHIMDGIMAMEGNGPGNGTPTPMKVLLFSEDPVALDAVFCHLVYLNPSKVPTNVQGQDMGIGQYEAEKIEVIIAKKDGSIVPSSLKKLREKYGNPKFDVDRKGTRTKRSLLSRITTVMSGLGFGHRPVIDKKKCIRCGICVEHCPVPKKAVQFKRGKKYPPVYDYKKCIRCYCCQEMCPKGAIKSK